MDTSNRAGAAVTAGAISRATGNAEAASIDSKDSLNHMREPSEQGRRGPNGRGRGT